MKSATKNTKINEIYKYIQKMHFLEKSTKTNWNVSKSTKYKRLQKNTLKLIIYLKKHAKNNRKSQKILRAGGAPRPRLGLQEAVQDFSAGGFGNLHFRVLGFGSSGCAHARDAPMPGIYTLGL